MSSSSSCDVPENEPFSSNLLACIHLLLICHFDVRAEGFLWIWGSARLLLLRYKKDAHCVTTLLSNSTLDNLLMVPHKWYTKFSTMEHEKENLQYRSNISMWLPRQVSFLCTSNVWRESRYYFLLLLLCENQEYCVI